MSVVDTRLDLAISEIKEWGKWGRIKENRQMYYANLSKYKTPGNTSPSAPCITLERACYIEEVIMATKIDINPLEHEMALLSIIDNKSTRWIADRYGLGATTVQRRLESTITGFAQALIVSDRLRADAPRTIFF